MPDWVQHDGTYVTTQQRIAELEALTVKAPQVTPRGDFTQLLNALTQASRDQASPYAGLPRDPRDHGQFGPSSPFAPKPLDDRDDGRADPRIREYPVSWNSDLQPAPHIPFRTLRDAADNIDMIRRCIELRKKEIAAREWSFTVAPWAVNRETAAGGGDRQDVQGRLIRKYHDEIERANDFWRFPGRNQDLAWADWIYAALEEYLVVDALVVYPQKTYGGQLLALDIVDGTTIKPLLDIRGAKPQWPHPAYQQVLYGFPRGEFTATTRVRDDGGVEVPGAFRRDQLYYIKRVQRPGVTPYGMSAVEQALISARLYLKRQGWMLSEYDDGTVPMAWIESVLSNGDIEMTAAQRRMWEDALNDELSGNTAARHRLKVMPPGMKAHETSSVDERYKPDYDLFLIKLLASHFDMPVSRLGFTETKGLGSAGFHESQSDDYERKATLPDTRWMSQQISRITHEQLGLPPEVIHRFTGLDEEDEAAQNAVVIDLLRNGVLTRNEVRARRNMPLSTDKEADLAALYTSRGIVYLPGSSELAPAGTDVEPATFKPDVPGESEQQQNAKPQPGPAQKQAELAAFHKWTRAHPNPPRPFKFEHVTPDDAPDLADDPRVTWS